MFGLDRTKSIEDILQEKGLITQDQLSAIKFENVNTGTPTTQIIKERGYVSDKDYAEAFGEVYNIQYADLQSKAIGNETLNALPLSVLKKYNIVPFELKDNQLSLAMADPLDLQTIEFVEKKTGYKVIPFISIPTAIEKILEDFRSTAIGDEISAALEEISQTTLKIEESSGDISDETLRDAPVARIVSMIMETAVKTGASDVHLEPGEKESRLRYRIDGILEEKRKFPKEMHESIVARIKILSKMKIDEKRIPQDGRFKVEFGELSSDLRVSTLPTIYGEKVVIRLLHQESVVFNFKDLGLRGLSLKRFEAAIRKPVGMILVTGPTGSGKNVTMATAIMKLNTTRVNIVTIEDPVEIRVSGVNHVQVNPKAGLDFATGLRAFLRQDPNIIFVGEIRDAETAELAIHAALTGHLVLSTLHTNSSSGAIPRLIDMGVEDFLLSSTLNAVVAQRLVRRICTSCKEEFEPPKEVQDTIIVAIKEISGNKTLISRDPDVAKTVKDMMSKPVVKLFKGKGCDVCNGTGYKGRVGIFELLEVDQNISHLTVENSTSDKIERTAVEAGMLKLMQDGFLRAVEGETTIEEVMRVAK